MRYHIYSYCQCPGFCVVYEIVIQLENPRKILRTISNGKYIITRILFLLLSSVILLYFRWCTMGSTKPVFKETDNPAAFANNLFTRVTSYSYIYFLNILLLTWPQWLCYDWSMGCIPLVKEFDDYRIVFPALLFVYIFKCMTKVLDGKPFNRLLILALALLVIPFLPASNILFPVGFVIAERILYIPSAGYCLLITIGYHKIYLWTKRKVAKKLLKIMFLNIIIIFMLRSYQRSFEWQTEYSLFLSGLNVCPLNAKVHYNVAKVADAANNSEWAMSEYKEAIRLYPEYYQAMNNLANMLKDRKQFEDAGVYLSKALYHKEDFPAAWMNLGIVLASTRKYKESEQAYNNAIKYRGHYPDCYYNLGNLYLELGDNDRAMECWYKAISQNPVHNSAWTNLLALFDNTGRTEEAFQLIPKALHALPESPSVTFAVANIYGKIDLYEEAEKYFLRALKLFGGQVKAIHYANLGVLYHRWKKYEAAEQMYEKALSIDPSFISAYKNIQSLKKLRGKYKP
ncbi:protein O-mannosyl-transferase TMTC4-like isoform X2 [Leptidea sinapis]|uniref:protein O-mannosyl-transferase TMTC4-like isoform X2 n=1 Tax=Leptidea sinapis TaxID=189913 RepID=UPI0021263D8A|nr:protein O-mannosyl-transferase TMTC4-like isoform X2 [Leptidea sinapis]